MSAREILNTFEDIISEEVKSKRMQHEHLYARYKLQIFQSNASQSLQFTELDIQKKKKKWNEKTDFPSLHKTIKFQMQTNNSL